MAYHYFTIAGGYYVVSYDAKVTSEGAPERGPTYACGGTPAEDPEFEVTVDSKSLRYDNGSTVALEMPDWLHYQIANDIEDECGEEIIAEHFARKADDRERAEEYRRER